MVPVELLWRGMSLVVMLAALVPFRPSTVVHVIETPHLARFLVGRQASYLTRKQVRVNMPPAWAFPILYW